jgi:hypothetical protein
MDSDTKEYLVKIMESIRRQELSAVEEARRHDALMKTLEELIAGAGAAYTRHYERSAKTLTSGPALAAIDQIIQRLKDL